MSSIRSGKGTTDMIRTDHQDATLIFPIVLIVEAAAALASIKEKSLRK
jgi:hypothetical protein